MQGINFNRLDLNLLKVFLAVLEEDSVTAAGERQAFLIQIESKTLQTLSE